MVILLPAEYFRIGAICIDEEAYTLAMYRVNAGHESTFIATWNELPRTFRHYWATDNQRSSPPFLGIVTEEY